MLKKLLSLKALSLFFIMGFSISNAQNGLSFDGVDDAVLTTNSGISG